MGDYEHEDLIHDTQIDYYGQYVASCSSDRTIKIWQIIDDATQKLVATLRGHSGPVWQVAWAHPKFSHTSVLASCSYDHKVIIWKETEKHKFVPVETYKGHTSSVNSIAWAPHEFGPLLAAASADGHISVLTYNPKSDPPSWSANRFKAHAIGCNAVSWAPCHDPEGSCSKWLATGGCDNSVNIWKFDEATGEWNEKQKIAGHQDWVRDVAWCPNVGVPFRTLATCSQDRTVKLWRQQEENSELHLLQELPPFAEAVWRLSWNVMGNILAVTTGDNKITLFKEGVQDGWKPVSTMDT
eukprot:EG_transcript_21910